MTLFRRAASQHKHKFCQPFYAALADLWCHFAITKKDTSTKSAARRSVAFVRNIE